MSTGSSGVVRELDHPGILVPVAVDVFLHIRDLYVVDSLGVDEQDVCHAIGFFDGVRDIS